MLKEAHGHVHHSIHDLALPHYEHKGLAEVGICDCNIGINYLMYMRLLGHRFATLIESLLSAKSSSVLNLKRRQDCHSVCTRYKNNSCLSVFSREMNYHKLN